MGIEIFNNGPKFKGKDRKNKKRYSGKAIYSGKAHFRCTTAYTNCQKKVENG